MSWLLFMDESGHDHKSMPFEVRGGIAIHASKLWQFEQDWQEAVEEVFGPQFIERGKEIKGSQLLDRRHFDWASYYPVYHPAVIRKRVSRFLTRERQDCKKRDFSAYGWACIAMVEKIFDLLEKHEAKIFASLIPGKVQPPADFHPDHLLRKDHIFLQERYFCFLESKNENGIFVMDQTENNNDSKFVKHLHGYYKNTEKGQKRTQWIVPVPLFVDSKMSCGLQAADVCLYCINWGFRLQHWNFTGQRREEIAKRFGPSIASLQFKGDVYEDGQTYKTFGIVYVPDPYTARGNNHATP